MNIRLKRWFRYIFCLILVMVLCWQSVDSSEEITNEATGIVSKIIQLIGRTFPTDRLYFIVRKTSHAIAFMFLSIFGHLAISSDSESRKEAATWSIIINCGTAITAEVFQIFTAGRRPSIIDGLINLAGVLIGILIAIIINYFKKSTPYLQEKTT